MPKYVRCEPAEMEVTETACKSMRSRGAFICTGCPGPSPIHGEDEPAQETGAVPAAVVSNDKAISASVPVAPAVAKHGFFVDFNGHEDLLAQFSAAVEEKGMTPGESDLDLIYLFSKGLLLLKKKKGVKR